MTETLETTLPQKCYLDDAFFRQEQEKIFNSQWFCVARRSEFSNSGDYRLVNIGRESIILTLDEHDTVQGFYNLCRHRGSQLIDSTSSNKHKGCFKTGIRCPYHSWLYGLDGKLLRTPNVNVDTTQLGLHRVDVQQWNGFVMVRLQSNDSESEKLETALAPITERVKRYPLSELITGHRIEYQVEANWKVILENYNECYHCAGVHPELCKIVPAFRRNGGAGLDWDRGVPHREGANTFTLTGTTTRAAFDGLNKDEKTRHKGELIYPNLMMSLSMDHVAAFMLFPRSPQRTDIICDFLFDANEMDKSDFDASDAVEFWDITNRQDWAICENVQRGMQSSKFDHGYYAPMEDLSLDIRNYIRTYLSDEL